MNLFEAIIIFVLLLGIGQILRRTKFEDIIRSILYTFIIYIALPALVLAAFLKNPIHFSNFILTSIGFVILLFGIFAAFFTSKFLNLDKPSIGSFIITSAHANTGFLGYPISFYFFGSTGLFYAVLYDLGIFIGLITVVTFTAGIYGKGRQDKLDILLNFFKFPPLYAFIFGMLIGNFVNAEGIIIDVINLFELIGSTSLFFTLLYLGMYLDIKKIFKFIKISMLSSFIKLVVIPLFALLIICAIEYLNIPLNPMEKNIILLQSLMPSGLMTIMLAVHYKLNVDVASGNVIVTTLISFFLLFVLSVVLF
ncbi:MAG: hypothetical protein BWK75_01770 [Candidatus Altiarchaeales archaeon A3]|nr:MAG: hypothetical protein BWK75_01770 [Candidatus Altiarchaeales archaeon A3]